MGLSGPIRELSSKKEPKEITMHQVKQLHDQFPVF